MKAFSTTDAFVELADFNSVTPSVRSIVGTSGGVSLFVPDGTSSYYIFLDKNAKTLYKIDTNTNTVTAQLYYKYFLDIKAIDVDLATGDIYLLQTYGLVANPEEQLESSSSILEDPNIYLSASNMVLGGGIMRVGNALLSVQHIRPSTATDRVYFRLPQDMKVDSVNRSLFVSDTANNRVMKFGLNSYFLEQTYSDSNMLMPTSLALSKSGDLFVVHYDKRDLKQRMSWYKSTQKQCEFNTSKSLSLSNFSYGEDDKTGWAYILDDNAIYEIDKDNLSKNAWASLGLVSPHSMATSWVSNNTAVKYSDGTVEKYYKTQQGFGRVLHDSLRHGNTPRLFAGHLNDALFDIAYDASRRGYYVEQISLDAPDIDADAEISPKLSKAVCGDTCLMNGNMYVISDDGNSILKIDAQRKTVLKTMRLGDETFNLISVSPQEERIWLANASTKSLAYVDRNLNSLHLLGTFVDTITHIHYDLWDESILWITSSSKTYKYDATTSTYVSLNLTSTSVRGICPSFSDYVWVFDKNNVYKVNNLCTNVQGAVSGFRDIKDLSCLNQIKDLFAAGYLPQSGQIKFDAVRQNVAWVYDKSLYLADCNLRNAIEINDFVAPANDNSSSSLVSTGSESSLSITGSPSSQSSVVLGSSSSSSISSSNSSLSSSSTALQPSSSSSTIRLSTSSTLSSASTSSSSSSSTGIEFYVVQETASFSNYDAMGQSYSKTSTPDGTVYAPKTGSYAANTEQRYGYLPENPVVRVPYWDSSYVFSAEDAPHSSNTVFISLFDSGNLDLRDSEFVNLMYGPDLSNIAYDYPCWGIKRLWINCMKTDGTSIKTVYLPIDENEQSYRYATTPLSAIWAFEGDGYMANGSAWIGRNRNISLTYRFDDLPPHAMISVYADIHMRGNWLGEAIQTLWKYNPGKSTEYVQVKNPYQAGYATPIPTESLAASEQLLSHGPHTFSILVK